MKQVTEKLSRVWTIARSKATPRRRQLALLMLATMLVTAGISYAAGVQSQANRIATAEGKTDARDRRIIYLEQQTEAAVEELADAKTSHRAELTRLQDEQATRTQELDDQAAALAERESALTAAEDAQAAREFGGGMVIVGDQVEAGTYRSGGTGSLGGCYWEWLSSTESDASIIDNGLITEGTTTVTLRDGQIFTSQSCGTWTRTD